MNWLNAPTYDIQRPTGHCTITGQPLEPGQTYIAALVEYENLLTENDTSQTTPPNPTTSAEKKNSQRKRQSKKNHGEAKYIHVGMKRVDISLESWKQGHRPDRLFSYWRSTVPQPNEKKKLFVDDEVLTDLLLRLGNQNQSEKLAFRFVLSLVLMRKKLLCYEGCEKRLDDAGQEQQWWQMKFKGTDQTVDILNPQIGDDQIQQVTEQLSQILETEL